MTDTLLEPAEPETAVALPEPAPTPRRASYHRLRGIKSLVHDAVDHVVDLVGIGHRSTARVVMSVLEEAGPLAGPARQVDTIREVVTEGILSSIKGANRLVEGLSDAGLDAWVPGPGLPTVEALVPLRSDVVGSAAWMADAAMGAANGVVGDQFGARKNGLDLGLALRSRDAWIGLDGQGVPSGAGPRIVLLVHGLATTEWSWCMEAALHLGDPAANFGTLLETDLGYTPLYARYNTGRPIRENGRALASRLQALVATWPVPVRELVLIGHSMGGLVIRSALQQGHQEGQDWVPRVHRAATLASPMRGAPLEKFGVLAGSFLSSIDFPSTLITGRILQGRSAGIQDLGEGSIGDPASLPPDVDWCFVTASLGPSPEHPLSQAMGDGLVWAESASGPAEGIGKARVHHFGGMHHVAVQVHPAVYAVLRDFLSEGIERSGEG